MVEKQRRASRRVPVIVSQQPTETISAHNCTILATALWLWSNTLIAKSLMIALVMIMGQVGSLASPVRNFTRRGNLGVYKAINGLIFLFSQPSCPERHDGIDFRTLCFYMDLEFIVNFCSVGARDPIA
jgi:hypothetical protein